MKRPSSPQAVVLCLAGLFALVRCATAEFTAATLPLQDSIKIPDQTIDFQKSVDLSLPALPAKPGKIIVLRLKIVSFSETIGGCNDNAALLLNGTPVRHFTSAGDERMIGRSAMFVFANYGGYKDSFPIFSGPNLSIIFAPDVKTGDSATKDRMGATFALNISDLARGVDLNTLTIKNIRHASALSTRYDLIVREIEAGWADKTLLPKPPNAVPTRGTIGSAVSSGALRLAVGNVGGFTVVRSGGPELLVETALGMGADAPSELLAEDSSLQGGPKVTREPFGPVGFRVTAVWPKVKLARTVEIKGDLVEWKERWTNTSDAILGMPFHHCLFLRGVEPRFMVGGDPDADAVACSAMNPTLFIQSREKAGCGVGVMMESDWLRLLSGLRSGRGVAEIYSDTMALAPQSSCDFFLTLTPVDSGGYWAFINSVRKRWGINRVGQSAPVFWAFSHATTEKTPEDNVRKALGHLGPVIVSIGPWTSDIDCPVVRSAAYPKLPPNAPRAPGRCPDFDVEKFLTFRHREVYWRHFADECALIHRACPGVRVIGMDHPAMEVVYKPLASRWPYASEEILTADGTPFEDAGYSRSELGDMVSKDWAVYYYAPRPGSVFLEYLLANERRSLDDCGADGMYWDEFSWAGTRRSYSRYDYSRWDGHSADLDPQGNVSRLKCDNAWITETAQLEIVGQCLRRGKFFLGNGAAALRNVNSLPVARFQEGGNGYGCMAYGHLSAVPLVFGNFGERKTRRDIFDSVKTALSIGCIYSPMGNDNLLLEGPDNFVCKLYPLTIRDLGAGVITAEERLITTRTGSFDWPGRGETSVRRYVYDEKGELTSKDAIVKTEAGKPLALTVPKDGMVIAEIVP